MQELREKLHANESKLRFTEDSLTSLRSELDKAKEGRRDSLAKTIQAETEKRVLSLIAKHDEMKARHKKETEMAEAMHTLKVRPLTHLNMCRN